MADKDAITKEYMQDNKIFADAFNFYMYDGKQVIKPEQLRPLDTTAIALPFGNDFNAKPVQKYRDVLKFLTAMTDDNVAYVIYGIEVQSKMHFAMPVRNMLYDAISYSNQVEETAKTNIFQYHSLMKSTEICLTSAEQNQAEIMTKQRKQV